MKQAWFSLASIFGVVPEAMSAWKPETAPQAMVINKKGNRSPAQTGPLPSMKRVSAGICSVGRMIRMPMASPTMVPILRKVER
ncbi:Uncharacterised protein [Edwardsiella tarda]|nr:Uncharacterised protein [Edwardsiella tarda]